MKKLLILAAVAALLAGFGATTVFAGSIWKSSDTGAGASFNTLVDDCIDTWVGVNASESDYQSPPGPGPGGGPPFVGVSISRFDVCVPEGEPPVPVSFGWAEGEPSPFSIDEKQLTSAMAVAHVDGWECPDQFDPQFPPWGEGEPADAGCVALSGDVSLEWTAVGGMSTSRSTTHDTYPDGSKQNCRNVDQQREATVAGTVHVDGNAFHGDIDFAGSEAQFPGIGSQSSRCTYID